MLGLQVCFFIQFYAVLEVKPRKFHAHALQALYQMSALHPQATVYVLITDSNKDRRSQMKKVSGFPCAGVGGCTEPDRVIKKWTFGSIVKNIDELWSLLHFRTQV